MTNIDIQKLINDPDYWDKMAPEGAEYYAPKEEVVWNEGWYKFGQSGWLFLNADDRFWVITDDEWKHERTSYKKPTRKSISYNENPYEESKTTFEEVAELCKQTNITLIFNESLSELGTYTIIDNDFDRSLMTGNIKTVLTVLKKKKEFLDEMNNWEWN